MATNKSNKRPYFESSDSEPEIIYQNTLTYMIIQSIEETTKTSPFKTEQILSKEMKPTIIKKTNKWNNTKVKLATVVTGDRKAPFSIATTLRCRLGCYSFPWIAPLYP